MITNNDYKVELGDFINKNVLPFSRYTITNRAIPAVEDGLKSIHRRVLWSMHLDGLHWDKKRTKSIKASGAVLRFSPHGDPYDTLVRLTNDSTNIPLLDGKGAYSSITTTKSAGASRYTNTRLSKYTSEIMKNIKKDAVMMIPNYDDSMLEPYRMPSTVPNILINPNRGIANGLATNICSFNINDVIDNTINIIDGKDTFIMYPDFKTGATIQKNDELAKQVKDTGRGSFKMRAKYKVVGNSIIVYEIPYGVTIESIIDKITDDSKLGKHKEIIDVNDSTGIQGSEIEIEVKKNTDIPKLMGKLYKTTNLEASFGCNFNVLVENKPETLGTDDILKEWLKFRVETVKNIINYDLKKKGADLHQLKGLERVLLDVDKAIDIIKNSETDELMIKSMMDEFSLDETQANNVSNMKLRNINKKFIINKTKQIKQLGEEVNNLEETLGSEKKVKELIKKELLSVKEEYGFDRMTDVVVFLEAEDGQEEAEQYPVTVFLTKDGYIKKLPHSSQRGNFINKLKDGDEVLEELELNNTGELLVFTDKYNVHKVRIQDIPDHKPSQIGTFITSEIDLEDSENVLYATVTKDFTENIIIGFDDGKVARIDLSAYETKQNRKKLTGAFCQKTAVLFKKITKDIDILAVSSINKALLFNTEMINVKTSRTTQGVQVQKSKDDSKTIAYHIVNDEELEYYRVKSAGVGKYLRKEDDKYGL